MELQKNSKSCHSHSDHLVYDKVYFPSVVAKFKNLSSKHVFTQSLCKSILQKIII